MKPLCRITALVISVVLWLNVLAFGAGAAVFSDEDSVTYKNAVQMLYRLHIIDGEKNEDGSYKFRPTDNITRAEFVKLVCVLLNGGQKIYLGETQDSIFKDVKGHWATKYIEFLSSLGYINGYGDGSFGPDNTITGQQAAKILLAVIGYKPSKEGLTGERWAIRTDLIANMRGFYKGLLSSFLTTDPLTREQAAHIVWNAMNVNMVTYEKDERLVMQDRNLLTFCYNVKYVDGYICANEAGYIFQSPRNPEAPAPGEFKTPAGKTYIRAWDNTNHLVEFSSDAEMLGKKVRVVYFSENRDGQTVNSLLSIEETL